MKNPAGHIGLGGAPSQLSPAGGGFPQTTKKARPKSGFVSEPEAQVLLGLDGVVDAFGTSAEAEYLHGLTVFVDVGTTGVLQGNFLAGLQHLALLWVQLLTEEDTQRFFQNDVYVVCQCLLYDLSLHCFRGLSVFLSGRFCCLLGCRFDCCLCG